jgi:hypothetical protein
VLTVGVEAFAALDAPATRSAPLEIVASAFDRSGRPRGAARPSLDPLAALAGEYLLRVETTMGARRAGRAMRFVVK